MKLENSFEVSAAPEVVWAYLLDVEKVIPCMPGAELTEVVDENNWKGRVRVALGPVSLAYSGKVHVDERDDAARRMTMSAKGTEASGKGIASAVVTSTVSESATGSKVDIVTDLTITGPAAQFGRGMVGDVSQRFTDEFAKCLGQRLSTPSGNDAEEGGGEAAEAGAESAAPPAAAKPISGIRLGIWALWRAIVRFFKRLFGGGSGE